MAAGIECPETAKFGNSGQAGGKEATDFASGLVAGKYVSVTLLSKDQYERVVGMTTVGRWPVSANLSSELLRAGHAVVYRQGGAEYGGLLETFNGLEAGAKAAKVGLWANGEVESAADYKKRIKAKESG